MNMQSDITNDHNQDHRFKQFDAKLDKIEQAVAKANKFLSSHNSAVYEALSLCLDLGYTLQSHCDESSDDPWKLLKEYLLYHGERWSSKCEINIFHGLVSIAFDQIDADGNEINSAPVLSRYRSILRYAFEQRFSSEEFKKLLEERSLIDVYQDAVSAFRFDPIDNYIEAENDKYQRVTKRFEDTNSELPEATFTEDLPKPDIETEYATAIVKLHDQGFNVLGFVKGETQEQIKAKLVDLVPDEAPYARQKLKEKNLYQLYLICDIFKRFTPNIATIRDWNKAHERAQLPTLNENSTQEEHDEYFKQMNAQSSNADTNKKKHELDGRFSLLNALHFEITNQTLIVSSRSTHPNTPCLEFSIPFDRPSFTSLGTLMIKDMDAN